MRGQLVIQFGKVLLILGAVLIVVGLILVFGSKYLPFGKIPGDITVKKENFSFYFPIVSCLVISAILTLIAWIIQYFKK